MSNPTEPSNGNLPPHWVVPKNPVLSMLFQSLCLISVSRSNLKDIWYSDLDSEHRKMVIDRLSNTNLVAGLLLGSSAVLISTVPPAASLLPYTLRGCYILALGSFVTALNALLCGLAVINIYGACETKWAKNVLMATRFRLCSTLFFIGFPALALAASILFLMLSLGIACWLSGSWWLQLLAALEAVGLVGAALLLAWCAIDRTLVPEKRLPP